MQWDAIPWDSLGPSAAATALAALLIRLIVSGRFVPREQVDMLLADSRAEVQYLRQARAADAESMSTLVKQNEKLALQGELSIALLRALQEPRSESKGSGNVVT